MVPFMRFPLINIDTAFEPLSDAEVTGKLIDARVSMLAYKNFDSVPRRFPFVLELCTSKDAYWMRLLPIASRRFWIKQHDAGVLVFDQTVDCGFIRTFRHKKSGRAPSRGFDGLAWTVLPTEEDLYRVLESDAAKAVHLAWSNHKRSITELPTEFVDGRLSNTNVEKAVIFSRGDGCVVCGAKATCYAATTMGEVAGALLIHLPVCPDHLVLAKTYPTIFQFLASLFQLSIDMGEVLKMTSIPRELVPIVHQLAAHELGASVGEAKDEARGWELSMPMVSGWRWLLRINSLTDYCYLLFEPGQKKPAYKADSAPHHKELKFFPDHQHSRPERNSDKVSPSFFYGHPLLDLKRLKEMGVEMGAIAP